MFSNGGKGNERVKKRTVLVAIVVLLAGAALLSAQGNPLAGKLNIKGKQIYVIYLSNETMSTWQSISNIYMKQLVESAGGKCDVFTADSDSQKQAQQFEDAIVKKRTLL